MAMKRKMAARRSIKKSAASARRKRSNKMTKRPHKMKARKVHARR
jgi:hypothetical protein